jgi:steroid delta-isomerase-like uncharacterized protein
MNTEYPTIAHRWFGEVWNKQRAEAIDEMLTQDVVGHGLTDHNGTEVRGVEQFKKFYHEFRAAFPDIKVLVEDTVSEADKVVARCRVTATHAGEGMGMRPTQRPVEFTGMCLMRLEDGKIAESWNSFDFLGLFTQTGSVSFAAR